MKKYLFATLLMAGMLGAAGAQAQTAPAGPKGPLFDGPGAPTTPRRQKATAKDIARMQRRMSMNPDQAKRDQQIEVLEARGGGNTSFGTGAKRQYERGSGGFVVRRFRDKSGAAMMKRGATRPAPGVDPAGKPLVHKHRKRFLFF